MSKECVTCLPKLNFLDAEEQAQKYRVALGELRDLIEHSDGVTGLHLNGDIATWDELRGDWLSAFDGLDIL